MQYSKVSSSIGNRLAASLAGKVGHRADLFLSDYEPINRKATKALIGYAENLGKPDTSEVESFVLKQFGGKVVADLTNARNKANFNVVECILKFPEQKRDYDDSKGMQTIVAGTRFMDTELGTIWETEADSDGNQFLVRNNKEDIGTIMMTRRKAMRSIANCVRFEQVRSEAGDLEFEKDDHVEAFYSNDQRQAIVASIGNDTAKLRLTDGKIITVAKTAILRVIAKTSKHGSEHIAFLRDFYKQFTSDEIVDKLYPPSKSTDNLA